MSDEKDNKLKGTILGPNDTIRLGSPKSFAQQIAESKRKRDEDVAKRGAIPKIINFSRIYIMPDCSGSMADYVGNRGCLDVNAQSKIDLCKTAISSYLDNCNENVNAVGIASFPDQCVLAPNKDYVMIRNSCNGMSAGGGTPLGQAMGYLVFNEQLSHAVIISDGDADDTNECLELAKEYKERRITVDTVHIGDSTGGEGLLKQIAELTGGIFIKFTDVSAFAKAFSYLAPAKRSQLTTSKNPVALLGCAEIKL